MVKVSCSYVVKGERGSTFSDSAKRPSLNEIAVYLYAPGRPAARLSACSLAAAYVGPAFTSFRQSLLQKKHSPVRPKIQSMLLPRMRYSRSENIDILAACHHTITT